MVRRRCSGVSGAVRRRPGLQPVVDVEEARERPAGVQPQQPGRPGAAQRPGVADGVVVEPPGQAHPRGGAGEVGAQRRGDTVELGRQVAQGRDQGVLGQLPVPRPGGPCTAGPGGGEVTAGDEDEVDPLDRPRVP